MVLTVAGIVVKILGGLNRIFLSRLLGGEGIGLYQMAYPVYILLLSISTHFIKMQYLKKSNSHILIY